MYTPEMHRTLKKVKLIEELDLYLKITDQAYQSDFESTGYLEVHSQADEQAVLERQHQAWNPFSSVIDALAGGEATDTNLGTKMHIGMYRRSPLEQDDNAFRGDHYVKAVDIEGLPENGTVTIDLGWDVEEAKESVSGDLTKVESIEYDVDNYPSNQLPIIVRGNLYRDARRIADVLGAEHDDMRGKQYFEGRAALTIEIENREIEGINNESLVVDGFWLEMSRTFPDVDFFPSQGMSYDPGSRRVEWVTEGLPPGSVSTYAIIGPIEELIGMDQISAEIRGEISGRSLSGLHIDNVYDESGNSFGNRTPLSDARSPELEELVKVTADVEIDPSALRGEAQKVSEATIEIRTTPQELFDEIIRICDRNSIHIIDREKPGDGEPLPGRDGVFEIAEGETGELDIRREYGDRGVVYAGFEISGRFTAETEETEVSAFQNSEDRLVRRPEGGLKDRGRSTLKIRARSTSSELNSRLISTIEESLGGDTL